MANDPPGPYDALLQPVNHGGKYTAPGHGDNPRSLGAYINEEDDPNFGKDRT